MSDGGNGIESYVHGRTEGAGQVDLVMWPQGVIIHELDCGESEHKIQIEYTESMA